MKVNKTLILREIKKYLDFRTDIAFSKFLGVKPTTLSSWYERNTFDLELIYAKCKDLHPDWLISGKGPMLRNTAGANANLMNVPFINQYAYGNYVNGLNGRFIHTVPTIPFVVPEEEGDRSQYCAFEMWGDSMEDNSAQSIYETDVVLAKIVQPSFYTQHKLPFKKWFYVIVHKKEGILIRQITAHDVAKQTIMVHGLNPAYPNKEISLKDVKQLFTVVQLFRKSNPQVK